MLGAFLDLLYPSKCPLCRELSTLVPCQLCRQDLIRDELVLREPVAHIDEVRSAFAYENKVAADCVKQFKYDRETCLLDYMAGSLLDIYTDWNPLPDAIVAVPIHRSRLSYRGFNQAEGLCARLPKELRADHLMRIRKTRPQVELTPAQRTTNLTGAFRCDDDLQGQRVLLVDDVFTTGATASECAKALRDAGANWVGVLCFAAKAG
jgi:ComF family protein